jgi:hypothetical protein
MNKRIFKDIERDIAIEESFHDAVEFSVKVYDELNDYPTYLKLRDRYLKAYERLSKYIQKHAKD